MYIRIPRRNLALILLVIFSLFFVNNAYYYQYNSIIKKESLKEINRLQSDINTYKELITYQDDKIKELSIIHSKINQFEKSILNAPTFKVTAYDLSYQSCQKTSRSKDFGITYSGFDLKGHTWKTSRVVAADPDIIPQGSVVYIQFTDTKYSKYNGLFKVLDTGSKIKGKRIDLFMEDTGDKKVSRKALQFGITSAKVIILK